MYFQDGVLSNKLPLGPLDLVLLHLEYAEALASFGAVGPVRP
jgi:hypothetical protein